MDKLLRLILISTLLLFPSPGFSANKTGDKGIRIKKTDNARTIEITPYLPPEKEKEKNSTEKREIRPEILIPLIKGFSFK